MDETDFDDARETCVEIGKDGEEIEVPCAEPQTDPVVVCAPPAQCGQMPAWDDVAR